MANKLRLITGYCANRRQTRIQLGYLYSIWAQLTANWPTTKPQNHKATKPITNEPMQNRSKLLWLKNQFAALTADDWWLTTEALSIAGNWTEGESSKTISKDKVKANWQLANGNWPLPECTRSHTWTRSIKMKCNSLVQRRANGWTINLAGKWKWMQQVECTCNTSISHHRVAPARRVASRLAGSLSSVRLSVCLPVCLSG